MGRTYKSTITCPKCNHQETLEMPTNFCQYFWRCTNCKIDLKAKKGDCCVFCSYGDKKCPSMQKRKK